MQCHCTWIRTVYWDIILYLKRVLATALPRALSQYVASVKFLRTVILSYPSNGFSLSFLWVMGFPRNYLLLILKTAAVRTLIMRIGGILN